MRYVCWLRQRQETAGFRVLRFYALKTAQVVSKRNTAQFRSNAPARR